MLGMLHKTNTITGASHLGAKPFIYFIRIHYDHRVSSGILSTFCRVRLLSSDGLAQSAMLMVPR